MEGRYGTYCPSIRWTSYEIGHPLEVELMTIGSQLSTCSRLPRGSSRSLSYDEVPNEILCCAKLLPPTCAIEPLEAKKHLGKHRCLSRPLKSQPDKAKKGSMTMAEKDAKNTQDAATSSFMPLLRLREQAFSIRMLLENTTA